MNDLIERLREVSHDTGEEMLEWEAADHIEELEADLERVLDKVGDLPREWRKIFEDNDDD